MSSSMGGAADDVDEDDEDDETEFLLSVLFSEEDEDVAVEDEGDESETDVNAGIVEGEFRCVSFDSSSDCKSRSNTTTGSTGAGRFLITGGGRHTNGTV